MNININVTRNFKINGKEYHSVEEMPDEIRQIYEKAMALKAGAKQPIHSAEARAKIIFNRTEYENVDTLPEDARQFSKKVLKAAESSVASSGISGALRPRNIRKSIKLEFSFSPRMLLMSAGLMALIFLLYSLFQNR